MVVTKLARERKIKRLKRKRLYRSLFIIVLLISTFIVTGIFINNKYLNKNIVEAKSVTEVFNIIGENNPINKALTKEIKDIEEEKLAIKQAERQLELEIIKENKRLAEIERENQKKEQVLQEDKYKKIAYLTFDDGPSKSSTYSILDILREYNIKATFFVLGKMVVNYPQVLLRTVEEGHAIGNHSYSHDYAYIYGSTKNFMRDMDLADKAIKKVLGDDFQTKVMRFPGGSHGKQKLPMIKTVKENGYKYFDWNALNGDAEGILMPTDYLIKRLKETYKNQHKLIVLMHDTDVKTTTVESLKSIIEFLISEGYEFRVIDDNYEK